MKTHPQTVVTEYFRRVADGDPTVASLFSEAASLVGLGTVVSGKEAIAAFYRESIERGGPVPALLGPLLVEGPRVAGEIRISLADGSALHVLDLFVVNDGLIDSLTYFISDHP
jgi:hypothetical protein